MDKTTEDAINDIATKKLEHFRKYNRDYYHAHKQAVVCNNCKKTYSSVSALRRHQLRNIKCQLLHERDTREKFQKMLQERLTNPDQEGELLNKPRQFYKAHINQTDRHNYGGGMATLLAALRCSHLLVISSICRTTSSGSGEKSRKTPLLLTV